MSERKQRTAAATREKMDVYYGMDTHHKHNKNHLIDPPHREQTLLTKPYDANELIQNEVTRKIRLRKIQRRLAKRSIH